MYVYIGADHAGFILKEKLKAYLEHKKIPYKDLGAKTFEPTDDYPDYAKKVAKEVVKNNSIGVLICGSGFGMCIAANKIKGARAVHPTSLQEVRLAREDDNANIICFAGRHSHPYRAKKLLEKFLITPFSQKERHIRRLKKIAKLER